MESMSNEATMKTSVTLKQVLLDEIEAIYTITENLFQRVTDDDLSWKPDTGTNWMTIGQLLMHCASFACGKAIQGFVKGDWDLSVDALPDDLDATKHVPPTDELPNVKSVKQALGLLAEDRRLALRCISKVEEDELLSKKLIAPWGGPELSLFQHLLLMIAHLAQHKGQLFYYLKLMGRDVNTNDLWGA
jgi:uncharacterized damage-inducible protein DinB